MKLIKSTLYDYEHAGIPKKSKSRLIIEEFLDSGYECAECIYSDKEYKRDITLQTSLREAIHKYSYPCEAKRAGGRVFLLRNPASVNV